MIEAFRRWGNSWAAKILLGILAASMGIFWGMGDLFQASPGSQHVATVGKAGISVRELQEALQARRNAIENRSGTRLSEAQVRQSQLPYGVLMNLISDKLMELEVDRLDLVVPDSVVKEAIRTNPAFQNPDKKFSREKFEAFLRNNRLHERQFLGLLKKEMRHKQLIRGLTGGYQIPSMASDLVITAQLQKRSGASLSIDSSKIKVPPPLKEDLQDFYGKNKERFRLAEKRGLTYALLEPEKSERLVSISQDDIQKAFDLRAEEFERSGKKLEDVAQALREDLVLQRQKTRLYERAQHIEDELASGEAFASVAEKYRLRRVQIAAISRHKTPEDAQARLLLPQDPALAQDILDTAFEGDPTEPVLRKNQGGMDYIVVVDKKIPARIPPLEESVERVKEVWLQEQREKKAIAQGQEKLKALKSGELSSKILKPLPELTLQRDPQREDGIAPQVKTALFEMAAGDFRLVGDLAGKVYVVHLLKIKDPSREERWSAAEVADRLRASMQEDMMQAFVQSLRAQFKVKIDRAVFAKYFS
jgi:hypothetical protein